jgi:hypothetical protein
MIGFAEKR